jgi:hypothetical protein
LQLSPSSLVVELVSSSLTLMLSTLTSIAIVVVVVSCCAIAIVVNFVARRALAIVFDVVVRHAFAIIVDIVARRAVAIVIDVVVCCAFAIIVDVLARRAVAIIIDFVACRAVAIIVGNSKTPAHWRWQRCHRDEGNNAIVTTAKSVASLKLSSLSSPVMPSPSLSTTARCLRIGDGNDAITTRATTPLQQGQRCLCIDGNNTIATRATTPAQRQQGACALMSLANLANLCCGRAHE